MEGKYRRIALVSVLLAATLACQTLQRMVEPDNRAGGDQGSEDAGQQPTTTVPLFPTEPEPTIPDTPEIIEPSLGLVFLDDFSNHESGWPVKYDYDSVIDYYQDGYRITINSPDSIAWAVVGPKFENVRIQVDARMIGGEEDNYFGVVCRYQDENNFYAAVISADGFSAIMARLNGSLDLISSDRFQESVVINQHMALNLIEVSCIGSQIKLYVNGQLIAEAEDSSIQTGDVGLIVGTINAATTDVLFDNYSLYMEE